MTKRWTMNQTCMLDWTLNPDRDLQLYGTLTGGQDPPGGLDRMLDAGRDLDGGQHPSWRGRWIGPCM